MFVLEGEYSVTIRNWYHVINDSPLSMVVTVDKDPSPSPSEETVQLSYSTITTGSCI